MASFMFARVLLLWLDWYFSDVCNDMELKIVRRVAKRLTHAKFNQPKIGKLPQEFNASKKLDKLQLAIGQLRSV